MQGKWGAPICRIGWLEHARRKATIMGGRPSGGLEMRKLILTTAIILAGLSASYARGMHSTGTGAL
jgi:hypothetical protein